jgi:hypothetical protein
MGLLQRFFSRQEDEDQPVTRPVTESSRNAGTRELLRNALRETLRLQGIPIDWLGCDVFASTSRGGATGFHWRLIVRHWDPRLVVHSVALEEALFSQLRALDPAAGEWLAGISWQFALADRKACPAMPAPHTWATRFKPPRQRAPGHDVDAARADLNRWLAQRDSEPPRNPDSLPPQWAPTHPAKP